MEVSDTDVRDPASSLCAVVRRCAHLGSKRVRQWRCRGSTCACYLPRKRLRALRCLRG